MYTSRKKLHKDKDAEPTEFEELVLQTLFDLENTNQELKSELKDLYINSAVQIDVAGSQKAVIIYVPFRLRKTFCKIHVKLVRELEKKFSRKIELKRAHNIEIMLIMVKMPLSDMMVLQRWAEHVQRVEQNIWRRHWRHFVKHSFQKQLPCSYLLAVKSILNLCIAWIQMKNPVCQSRIHCSSCQV